MSKRTIATARVTVTLQVDCDGTWADDCTLGQMHSQAEENAVQQVRYVLQEHVKTHKKHLGITIFGEPAVELVSAVRR